MTFWEFVLGYITARYLFEKAIPTLFELYDTWTEGSKWFNKKPSKFDDYFK